MGILGPESCSMIRWVLPVLREFPLVLEALGD